MKKYYYEELKSRIGLHLTEVSIPDCVQIRWWWSGRDIPVFIGIVVGQIYVKWRIRDATQYDTLLILPGHFFNFVFIRTYLKTERLKLKFWEQPETQIVKKNQKLKRLQNSNSDKTLKLKLWHYLKLKFWQCSI